MAIDPFRFTHSAKKNVICLQSDWRRSCLKLSFWIILDSYIVSWLFNLWWFKYAVFVRQFDLYFSAQEMVSPPLGPLLPPAMEFDEDDDILPPQVGPPVFACNIRPLRPLLAFATSPRVWALLVWWLQFSKLFGTINTLALAVFFSIALDNWGHWHGQLHEPSFGTPVLCVRDLGDSDEFRWQKCGSKTWLPKDGWWTSVSGEVFSCENLLAVGAKNFGRCKMLQMVWSCSVMFGLVAICCIVERTCFGDCSNAAFNWNAPSQGGSSNCTCETSKRFKSSGYCMRRSSCSDFPTIVAVVVGGGLQLICAVSAWLAGLVLNVGLVLDGFGMNEMKDRSVQDCYSRIMNSKLISVSV